MGESGPFGELRRTATQVAVENFHALRQRQTSDKFTDPADGRAGQPAELGRQGRGGGG